MAEVQGSDKTENHQRKNILRISLKVVMKLYIYIIFFFFTKCIIPLIGKYAIRRQINVFKYSFSVNNLLYNSSLKKKKSFEIPWEW